MTPQQIISIVDELTPNKYSTDRKLAWLTQIDGQVYYELIATHSDGESITKPEYTTSNSNTAEMLIPKPYCDDVYRYYLESQIDLANAELGKYNNSIALFNNAYLTFSCYHNRTHLPLQKNKIEV